MSVHEIEELIKDPGNLDELTNRANEIRKQLHGDKIFLRGIIEFSNHCSNACVYCGLNCNRADLRRYALSWEKVLETVKVIRRANVNTIVLQSGESGDIDVDGLAKTIEKIKSDENVAVTLSCGEWPREVYELWKRAGADRYLLKMETIDQKHYEMFHPGMSYKNRLRCLDDLFELDYELGTGNIVGLPEQTPLHLAKDISFFKERPFDMLSVGAFVPAEGTPLENHPMPETGLVMKALALTRIAAPEAHIPATTSLCSIGKEARRRSLFSGANVIMPNFTPVENASDYNIYKKAPCRSTDNCWDCLHEMALELNLEISHDIGSGFRKKRGA